MEQGLKLGPLLEHKSYIILLIIVHKGKCQKILQGRLRKIQRIFVFIIF